VKRWLLVVIGAVLALAGIVWTLQGLGLTGQSGGMNGQRVWAIIGPIVALGGLFLIRTGARGWRSPKSRTASR
jgi:hypothetical protein